MHGIMHAAYACVVIMIVQNFGTKFLLRMGECKTRENSNLWKKGKIVISVKTRNFSRSRMTKRISSLDFTFFEASRIGCRKTCDVMKVTYNIYSCDISCMSREIMGTDGRDSAKCRKSKAWGHICHFWKLK